MDDRRAALVRAARTAAESVYGNQFFDVEIEAAISLALEEAAKVADWPHPASEGWGEEMAGRIAAAEDIRALKGNK